MLLNTPGCQRKSRSGKRLPAIRAVMMYNRAFSQTAY